MAAAPAKLKLLTVFHFLFSMGHEALYAADTREWGGHNLGTFAKPVPHLGRQPYDM